MFAEVFNDDDKNEAARRNVQGALSLLDTEDERLETTLELLDAEDVDAIVCTGDVVDGTGSPDRAAGLLQRAGVLLQLQPCRAALR